MEPRVPISVGELLDKISILEIKQVRISDAPKRANVERELTLLQDELQRLGIEGPSLSGWRQQLRQVNEQLWDIEDHIRRCEASQQFDAEFVRLARAVYQTNDERSRIKREINRATGSRVVEEKSYDEAPD